MGKFSRHMHHQFKLKKETFAFLLQTYEAIINKYCGELARPHACPPSNQIFVS
jgi:hypothetical protein